MTEDLSGEACKPTPNYKVQFRVPLVNYKAAGRGDSAGPAWRGRPAGFASLPAGRCGGPLLSLPFPKISHPQPFPFPRSSDSPGGKPPFRESSNNNNIKKKKKQKKGGEFGFYFSLMRVAFFFSPKKKRKACFKLAPAHPSSSLL